jgi:hypothetical protein
MSEPTYEQKKQFMINALAWAECVIEEINLQAQSEKINEKTKGFGASLKAQVQEIFIDNLEKPSIVCPACRRDAKEECEHPEAVFHMIDFFHGFCSNAMDTQKRDPKFFRGYVDETMNISEVLRPLKCMIEHEPAFMWLFKFEQDVMKAGMR